MAGPLGEPRDWPPRNPPPRGAIPPPLEPASTAGLGQAQPVPICYGTVKIPIQVIEKFAPFVQQPDPWLAGSFNVGQFVSNVGNAYECIVAGTSVDGPSGTTADFTDSGTAHWKYRQQLPFPIYLQSFVGALCEGEIIGALSVWFDKEHLTSPSSLILPKMTALRTGPDAANQTIPASFDQAGYQHTALIIPLGTGSVSGTQSELMNIAVELHTLMFAVGSALAAPILTATGLIGGGSLGQGTYYVKVAALNASGESLASNEVSVFVFAAGSIGLTWTAVVGATGYRVYLGTSSSAENTFFLPGNVTSFTITSPAGTTGGPQDDVSPADIVNDILTHARRGVNWPSSRVDTSITGTAASGFRVYCDAAGLRFSMQLQEQKSAGGWIDLVLQATNSEGVWSASALKIVPLGDQPIAAPVYGATGYVPTNTPTYDLTLDDFLDHDFPVQVVRKDDADCFNTFPIEFSDRSQAYARTTVEDPDQLDVDSRGGKRVAETLALPMTFADGTRVTMLSRIRAQRSLKNRNTYTFRLAYWSMLLEPTDVVTLPAEVLGVKTSVRITSMREDPGNGFSFTAQDYPAAVHAAAAYTPQAGDGYKANELATTAIIPSQVDLQTVGVKDGALVDVFGTRGGNVDNIWPNHTSENLPPVGADTRRPEWAGRVNDAGAFAGTWVRQLTALTGARQLLGDVALDSATIIKPAYQSQLGFQIRCSPGESFFMGSQVRFVAPSTMNDGAGVGIAFLDASKQILTVSAFWDSAIWDLSLWDSDDIVLAPSVFPSAWTRLTAFGVAPTGSIYAHFFLFANSDQGQVTAQFDGIFAAKQIEKGLLNNETWTAPTFLNGWANRVGSTQAAGFFEDLFGIVHLRGTIASGTLGLSAFPLPVGYRPAADMRFGVDSNGAYGRVVITAAGDVIPDIGSATAVSLDGIKYDTRN